MMLVLSEGAGNLTPKYYNNKFRRKGGRLGGFRPCS